MYVIAILFGLFFSNFAHAANTLTRAEVEQFFDNYLVAMQTANSQQVQNYIAEAFAPDAQIIIRSETQLGKMRIPFEQNLTRPQIQAMLGQYWGGHSSPPKIKIRLESYQWLPEQGLGRAVYVSQEASRQKLGNHAQLAGKLPTEFVTLSSARCAATLTPPPQIKIVAMACLGKIDLGDIPALQLPQQ